MEYSKEFLRSTHEKTLTLRRLELKILDHYAQGRVPGHIHSAIAHAEAAPEITPEEICDNLYAEPYPNH